MKMNKTILMYYLRWTFRIVLAAVLLMAGVLKLQDPTSLFETMAYITWLPVWLKHGVVDFLPYFEILLALLLVTRWLEPVILPLVGLIFFGFLGFAIYGTATGLEIDCGCFGELMNSEFGPKMIIRNALFAGMALFLFQRPGGDRHREQVLDPV